MTSESILGLSLRCDRRAPRLARRALERALATAPVLDDARLVATELINNAVLHLGWAGDDIIRVVARLDGGFLIISVHSPAVPTQPPQLSPRDVSQTGGFGLQIIKRIAHRWGADRLDPDGHRVWAALPVRAA